ncbi:respiratory nitrate reductase subunit gamma [Pelosinus baikalensis]|uniref:Respiratory nitrate reductase subunit gamma n=1 Tax=Pelosinus baikalensis TaxID=2892015 RepID=A0ABS8HQK1_9FIRM|nr:respiratory nitrate reductase subunit gamma [Pelosinus baikalensis]MCC5464849.1 respiratory nitrate reductase subunit gamma [Pelosinus baikalensis]
MKFAEQFLWVIYPYIALTIFVVGHIYRYNTDQLGWTAKSSELLEKRSLWWGSMLFHAGILAVVGGHISGLLIPKVFFESIGVNEQMYHMAAVYGGGPAGLVTLAGILILTLRRVGNDRVFAVSSAADLIVVILVLIEVSLGLASTITNVLSTGSFDYRETIGPWFRGLLFLQPAVSFMAAVPLVFKLHVIVGFGIVAIWPFTRLVHVWSMPIEYINRAYIQYFSKDLKVKSLY